MEKIEVVGKNCFVSILNKESNTLVGKGIVESVNQKTKEITVRMKGVRCNRTVEVGVIVITNLVTYIREFKAILNLQSLPHRQKILDLSNQTASMSIQCTAPVFPDKVKEEVVMFFKKLNDSQKIGVNRALKQPITLIQGPPGTGKTRSIISIIDNAFYS